MKCIEFQRIKEADNNPFSRLYDFHVWKVCMLLPLCERSFHVTCDKSAVLQLFWVCLEEIFKISATKNTMCFFSKIMLFCKFSLHSI